MFSCVTNLQYFVSRSQTAIFLRGSPRSEPCNINRRVPFSEGLVSAPFDIESIPPCEQNSSKEKR